MEVDIKDVNAILSKHRADLTEINSDEAFDTKREFIKATEGQPESLPSYDPIQRRMYLKSFFLGRIWLKIKDWWNK